MSDWFQRWQSVLPRFNGETPRCEKCGVWEGKDPGGGYYRESLEIHHIIPVRLGGTDDPTNLMLLCKSCHRKTDNALRRAEKAQNATSGGAQ